MKKIIVFMLSAILTASCSTPKVDSKANSENKLSMHRENCLKQKIALDCAKYAYLIKPTNPSESLEYYKKGCALGESGSCYNLKSIEDSALIVNQGLVNSRQSNLYGCYVNYLYKEKKKTFAQRMYTASTGKETINLEFQVEVKKNGTLGDVSVEGYRGDGEGMKCIRNALSSLRFIPSQNDQIFNNSFTMEYVPFI